MNSVVSNNLSLKYQGFTPAGCKGRGFTPAGCKGIGFTPAGCKGIGFRNFEFVAKTQFVWV